MATETKEQNNNKNPIQDLQQTLGIPEEKHFTKKTPLLKLTIGNITSNLALAEYWNDDEQCYNPPVPAYSFYFMDNVIDASGKTQKKTTMIPIPKDKESIKALADHLARVAKALDGIELKSSSSDVDDLDAAIAALKQFKTKGA